MASSEDLVPKGLPQGSRQENVAAMQAAGVPLGSEAAGNELALAPPAPPAAPPIGGSVPARQQMQGFDVFSDREPSTLPPVDSQQVVFSQVRNSSNAVLQDIFGRVEGYKEG